MDGRRFSAILFCGLSLSFAACAPKKSASTVFPQAYEDTSQCPTQNRILNQFLINYEDGRFEVRRAKSKQELIENFVKPNIDNLRLVEFDARVYTSPVSEFSNEVVTQSTEDWGQKMSEADEVWSSNVFGEGIKVAVVDATVDYTHPQIAPRLLPNLAERDGVVGVDDDGNGFVDDVYGWDFYGNTPEMVPDHFNQHGSHVAGIILADHTTGPIKGLAPKAQLIPVNFMDQGGGGTLGAAIEAIKYAAQRGAQVINASWGGGACSQTLSDVIRSLADRNILFIAASGNEYIDFDRSGSRLYSYPAVFNLPNQITVAATDIDDKITDFSNKSFSLVHIGAPGKNIFSTVTGGEAFMTGTSMAAPFVSGAAALLLSAKPGATFAEVKAALLGTVDVPPNNQYKVQTRGRLNVRKALESLQ